MKFKINLATEPYENARRFYLFWGTLLVAVAILTGALVYGALAGWRNAHVTNGKIAIEKSRLEKLKQLEQQDVAILNKPENRDVRDKSQVLNNLILQKAFSWTMIFSDLEHLVPTRLHVISITPQLDKSGEVEVHMVVAGDSREKAIELVHNMENSRDFRRAQVLSESATRRDQGGPQSGDTIQFEITAQYVPTGAAAQERSGQ